MSVSHERKGNFSRNYYDVARHSLELAVINLVQLLAKTSPPLLCDCYDFELLVLITFHCFSLTNEIQYLILLSKRKSYLLISGLLYSIKNYMPIFTGVIVFRDTLYARLVNFCHPLRFANIRSLN
jgi:hypothetical protein